jgi:hypothetical protein
VPDHLTLQVSQPGSLTVRVRYTSFWTVASGAACLSSAPDGWTAVEALTSGTLELSATMLHPSTPAYCPAHPSH